MYIGIHSYKRELRFEIQTSSGLSEPFPPNLILHAEEDGLRRGSVCVYAPTPDEIDRFVEALMKLRLARFEFDYEQPAAADPDSVQE
jgi:hypothetical protein